MDPMLAALLALVMAALIAFSVIGFSVIGTEKYWAPREPASNMAKGSG
jgi:hypothetical protein